MRFRHLALPSRRRRAAVPTLAVAAIAIVALAACSSSGSSKTSSTTKKPSSNASATTASPGQSTTLKAVQNPTLGTILVDQDGRTVYTLTNGGTAVPCTGPCLGAWPPVMLPSGQTQTTGPAGLTYGQVSASGGTQATVGGDPVYRYAGDSAAGQANGEGLSSFGGTWHVVKVTSG